MTKEDIEQIGDFLHPIRKQLDTIEEDMVTKEDIKEIVETNNRVLGTQLKVELAETNKRIDALVEVVKEGFQETNRKLDTKVQGLEKRIEIIEVHLEPPHKN